MKSLKGINQRIEDMDKFYSSAKLVELYGTKREFDADFLRGFVNGLKLVSSEKLDREQILKAHHELRGDKEHNKEELGKRNAYAWCLDWKTTN